MKADLAVVVLVNVVEAPEALPDLRATLHFTWSNCKQQYRTWST